MRNNAQALCKVIVAPTSQASGEEPTLNSAQDGGYEVDDQQGESSLRFYGKTMRWQWQKRGVSDGFLTTRSKSHLNLKSNLKIYINSIFADEAKRIQICVGAKTEQSPIFAQLPLISKKSERLQDLQPQTPRHKRMRRDNAYNVFAWNSSEASTSDLCGFRLTCPKRRISDPSGHSLGPEADKKIRIDDESYLSPLPPISAPTPKVNLPALRHPQLHLTKSFTHNRCMSEDLSNSAQVELSRLSFI